MHIVYLQKSVDRTENHCLSPTVNIYLNCNYTGLHKSKNSLTLRSPCPLLYVCLHIHGNPNWQVRGGPFDIWGGVEENMEINKIFPILLKINKIFPSLLEINKLFLILPEKNELFHPKNNLFVGLIP